MSTNGKKGYFEPTKGDELLEEGSGIPERIRKAIASAQKSLPDQHVELSPLVAAVGKCSGTKISLRNTDLSEDISGSIRKITNTRYRIEVNENHHIVRRRFTIAHELAHFLLHKDEIGNGITEDLMLRSEQLGGKAEWEANSLAAAILMPRKVMEAAVRVYSPNIGNAIASVCKVSKIAAQIRLGSYVAFTETDQRQEIDDEAW